MCGQTVTSPGLRRFLILVAHEPCGICGGIPFWIGHLFARSLIDYDVTDVHIHESVVTTRDSGLHPTFHCVWVETGEDLSHTREEITLLRSRLVHNTQRTRDRDPNEDYQLPVSVCNRLPGLFEDTRLHG